MPTTGTNLFRGIQKDQYSDFFTEGEQEPKDGLLYPTFQKSYYVDGKGKKQERPADMVIKDGKVQTGRGVSMFDTEGVLGYGRWKYFWVPEGTEYDENLLLDGPGPKKAIRQGGVAGCHYQFEPKIPLTVASYKGMLDNLARAAVVRQVKLGNGAKEEKKE
ncbi:hypothetical protein LMG28727_07656 [Paraburkholderia kirstenboschensis]|uniref:Tse2 family ADP-ribosyltransferase toxin n=1 Tax=Paraburkholderia kirstenboschensis TaxID=1245436 RepID=UPI000ADCD49B|nr:hypothetical protein [Paraburkholderia kirstenboschensis]CAD6562118.1 hypothetical protein LMG28727_07656 [Paraburkholderia kirstenboschensis]